MTPLLANAFENVGRTILNFLAIGGGFLIGTVVAWTLVRLVTKFMLKRKPNVYVDKIARVVGGIVGAILIALLVFGDGGWGFGGSGGGLPGGPGGTDKQQPGKGNGEGEPKNTDPTIPAAKIKIKPPEVDDRVKIVVLGGQALPDKFYLFEDETAPSTLRELTLKVEARDKLKKLKGLEVFVYKNSAALDSAVVGDVKDLARKMNLSIDFAPVQKELRPER